MISSLIKKVKRKVKLLSHVQLFVIPGLPTRLLHPSNFPSKSTGVGCHFILQRIFPTQGSNPGLLHCRQALYRLSHQGRNSLKCTELVHQGTGTVTSATIRKLQMQEAMAGWRSLRPVARDQMWPRALLAPQLHCACWNPLQQQTLSSKCKSQQGHLRVNPNHFWSHTRREFGKCRASQTIVSAMKEVILEGGCNRRLGVQILNFSRTAC